MKEEGGGDGQNVYSQSHVNVTIGVWKLVGCVVLLAVLVDLFELMSVVTDLVPLYTTKLRTS